jgi:hypothetical protein
LKFALAGVKKIDLEGDLQSCSRAIGIRGKMKRKPMNKYVLGTSALLLLLNTSIFAIEGLQVSVQNTNVVVAWPGDPSKNYIVQYCPELTSTNGWETLTSSWPGDPTLDTTVFVQTNGADYGYAITNSSSGGSGGGGGGPLPPGGGGSSGTNNGLVFIPGVGFYRVVQDGVRISNASMFALTNGTLSNSVTISFEAGNAANDGTGTNVLGDIKCADFIVDGLKFSGDSVLGAPTNGTPWQFSMDSAFLENGDHLLQVEVTWKNPDNSDGNNVFITRQSDPVFITVSNLIYYPQWEEDVGEAGISAYFFKTVFTNVPWKIDIYDVSNKLAQTLTNISSDGIIEAYWDMMDTNGVKRTNADLDPEFNAVITVYDAPISKKAPKKKQKKNDWPDHGHWVISYQDFFKFQYSANDLMKNSINTFANTAAKYGGYYLYYPPSGSTNDIGQTYPLRYQKANHFDASITADTLLKDDALLIAFLSSTNSRNFYYNGHGDANIIGDNIDPDFLGLGVHHRYRFVFLDGCNTANGKLDAAFGIHGPGTFDISYYENIGKRPAAFCGYNRTTPYAIGGQVVKNGVTYDNTIPDDVPNFIINFLFYWDLETRTLRNAYDNARNFLSPVAGWYPGDGLQIYGYDGLKIDEFNHAGDTW